jgi:26 proteasome complex subunit DSS1
MLWRWGKKLTGILLDWTQDETEVPGDNTHLWEESWDDDDTSEDFSAQLKYIFSP